MATINIGGRTVDVPDDLDPARPAGPTLHGGGSPTPQATPSPTAAFDAEVAQRAARLRQGGMPAPAAPPTPLTPAGPPTANGGALYKAGSAAGKATDWLTGGKPGAFNRTMGTLGRVGGLAAVGESFMDNVQGMGNVFHSPDAKISDKLAAGVEGAGNIIGTGALSLPSRLPFVGPVISGAVGPNPASLLADTTGDSVLNKFNPGKGFGSTRVAQLTDAAAPQGAPAPAAAPAAQPASIKDPYAAANAAKLATGGTNAPAAAPPVASGGEIRRIDRPGQSPLFTNMPDEGLLGNNALMGRRSAPTAQNVAAMDALVARDALRSEGAALSSQYADEVRQAQAINQAEAARRNSWESRVAQWNDPFSGVGLARRNMEVSLGSMTPYHHRGKGGAGDALKEAQMAAYSSLAKEHFGMAAGDRDDATRRYQSDQTLRGNMYQSDQTLRGNIYQTDGQLAGKRQESALRQQQQMAMGQIFQMAGNDPVKAAKIAAMYGLDAKPFTDMAQADQTRQYNATTNASKRLEGMAVVKNDKGEMVISPGRLAKLNSTLGKMSPGWQHMDEPGQAAALAKAEASVNLLEGLNDRRNSGFWQAVGIDGKKPDLSTLPDMQGGRLEEVGTWEGATAGGGVGRNDYALVLGDGKHRLHLPRGAINQGELELLKERGVDISGLSK